MVQCDSVLKKNNLFGISHCFLVPADFTPRPSFPVILDEVAIFKRYGRYDNNQEP